MTYRSAKFIKQVEAAKHNIAPLVDEWKRLREDQRAAICHESSSLAFNLSMMADDWDEAAK